MTGEYKSKEQRWLERLTNGDWVLHATKGLCQVLLNIPQPNKTHQFLLQTKVERELFWCFSDEVKAPHKLRWVRTKKKKPRKSTKKKKPGRKKLYVKVNDLSTGIPIYFDVDKTTQTAQFPCVIVSLLSAEPFRESKTVFVHEYLFSFLRHAYAKPIQATYRMNLESREEADKRAAKACGEFIAAVIREKYW